MPDDDKAKAEKLAAAKKRVEQLKKQKAAKQTGASSKKDDKAAATPAEPPAASSAQDEKAAATGSAVDEDDGNDSVAALSPTQTSAPSLSEQSKARSASFRKPSISGPLSPISGSLNFAEGETAPEIYRKHVARIEELERENKRLAKDAADGEKRWQRAEEELADLREADGDSTGKKSGGSDSLVQKLRNDLAAAQRQRDQLQAQLSRAGGPSRHGSSPSISLGPPPGAELEAQLASKQSTIESMELEMSRLRAQVERLAVSAGSPGEQIAALEEKLARAERAAALAQRELGDAKANIERAAEKAVRAGSERASAETKARALEREAAEATTARDEARTRADALEKKAAALATLQREQDARAQALRRESERRDKELADLRDRLERAEAEGARLRRRDARDGAIGDDDAVDELEDEERKRLEARVRTLEAENHDLRRGIWHERRKEMQVGPDDASLSPGGRFTDVDLSGSGLNSPSRGLGAGVGGMVGDFFTSGLNALTGTANAAHGYEQHGHDYDGFLEDDDDDMDFDEDAFRRAREEDARKRLERVKELKRGLKNWEGWRLDLVESRRGGGEGIGEIFEV